MLRCARLLALVAGLLAVDAGGGAPSTAPPATVDGPLVLVSAGFEDAAAAMRRHDCAGAQAALATKLAAETRSAGDHAVAIAPGVVGVAATAVAESNAAAKAGAAPDAAATAAASMARLLRGVYAAECGDAAAAETYLAQAVAPGGVLEDWR